MLELMNDGGEEGVEQKTGPAGKQARGVGDGREHHAGDGTQQQSEPEGVLMFEERKAAVQIAIGGAEGLLNAARGGSVTARRSGRWIPES